MSIINSSKNDILLVMGGTFDPIHLGHTLPAKETAQWLNAEKVILIPAHIPPHKNSTHANAKQRITMTQLACANQTNFEVDDRELQRHGQSFTVDTLMELKTEQPKKRIHFMMGMDSLLTFTQWRQWQEILTLCHLVVNIRPGYSHQQLENHLSPELHSHIVNTLEELSQHDVGKIILHKCTAKNIASTDIRQKVKNNENYAALVNQAVYQYIEQQQLYR